MNPRKVIYSCLYIVAAIALPEVTRNGIKFIGSIYGGIFDASLESIGAKTREEIFKRVPEFMQGWFK